MFRIGITPSALINEYLGFQLNAAINLTCKFQVNLEAGKIIVAALSDLSDVKGYRIRPALRYYVIENKEYLMHVSLAYNFRKTIVKRTENFSFTGHLDDIIADFEQIIKMEGLAAMVGVDIYIGNRLIIDIGIGLSDIDISNQNAPEGGIREFHTFKKYEKTGEKYPLIISNMRVQYIF